MAEFIKIYEENPSEKHLETVVKTLKKGGIIIYPTGAVYCAGCDITNNSAMERLAKIKGIKPQKTDFSIIFSDLSNLSNYVRQLETHTFKILKKYLPGPYTFILPSINKLPKFFKGKKTIGIRIPESNITQQLVKMLGNPIAATSVHDEDAVVEYTTDPELIHEKWQHKVDLVIDAGFGGNVHTTVVDLSSNGDPVLLRKGLGDGFDDC
jgi:tRNA threonylcarbamoyl adenosine modification protein (Sua5/YciO/YrdC/YwlC family)